MDARTLESLSLEVARLRKRLERERRAREEAEQVAENGLRDLYENQRQLRVLEAVAVAANQASSLDEAMQGAIVQICELYRWPLGHAWQSDPRTPHRLTPTGIWYCADAAATADFREATAATCLDRGVGLPGRVLDGRQPVWIGNIAQDPNFVLTRAAQRNGLKSALAFPILVGERVFAVLEFFNTVEMVPDRAQLRLMAQVGLQLGRVAERQVAREQLIYDALHDVLTGLPNRALFLDALQGAVARRAHHPERDFAVLFIDVDRFKVVNDSLGHAAGDRLLVQIGQRIAHAVRSRNQLAHPISETIAIDGVLARMGGDEFALLLDDLKDPGEALAASTRILAELGPAFHAHGQDVHVDASIGVATPAGEATAEGILRNAELAMYRSKHQGGARCEFFDRGMHAGLVHRLTIETELRHALEHGHFVLHYQPIVCLRTGAIVGVEALVRWRRSEERLTYPGDFIQIAEDSGLIALLDMWVLREACISARGWNEAFPQRVLRVAVNLSARTFALRDLVAQVSTILADTRVEPGHVRLEITESATMDDTRRGIAVMRELKDLGVHLSIDDFGTGYSSLSYLHQFPVDTLKIDRSFIARIDESDEGFQIVRSILSLARNLGMQVVAEGPETTAQVRRLQEADCDFGQGYVFARPLPADQITGLLESAEGFALADGYPSVP